MLPTIKNALARFVDFLLPPERYEKEIALLNAEQFQNKTTPARDLGNDGIRAVFSYKDPMVKSAIWLLKYRQNEKAADLLAGILGNVAAEWLDDLLVFENFARPLLVPVPMSEARRAIRGDNHTEIICRKMMAYLPLGAAVYTTQALNKNRETDSQARTKNKGERLKNLQDSFSADSKIVKDRNILIIDDVTTTGATIHECRKVLRSAGAEKVVALCIAH